MKELNVIETIQNQKDAEMERKPLMPLDAEGAKVAEDKRFTFDIIDTPTDPLR